MLVGLKQKLKIGKDHESHKAATLESFLVSVGRDKVPAADLHRVQKHLAEIAGLEHHRDTADRQKAAFDRDVLDKEKCNSA